MSAYEQLPIYKKAQDLAIYFECIVRHFDKHNKYRIGSDLCNISRKVLILVRRRVINNLKVKIKELRGYPEKLKVSLASYMGHFRWANSYRLTQVLINECQNGH